MPPPMHIVTIPYCAFFLCNSRAMVAVSFAPVHPRGWPSAIGHPLGCTGAKLTATLARDLQRKNAQYGMVTMCIGGGMGAAGIFERV